MRIAEWLLLCALASGCDPVSAPPDARVGDARMVGQDIASALAEPRLLTPADPAGSILDLAYLQGRWTVVGVALSDGPVQAYVTDDPAFMGRSVIIAGQSIHWHGAGTGSALADDRCPTAATMRLPAAAAAQAIAPRAKALQTLGIDEPTPETAAPHEIACLAGGQWGPPTGTLLFPVDRHNMIMTWYDNVVLKLQWRYLGN